MAAKVETWRCKRCGERKTIDRVALHAGTRPFSAAGYRAKPETAPPEAADVPPELTS